MKSKITQPRVQPNYESPEKYKILGGIVLITRNNNWETGSRKRTINQEIKIGPVSLKFITIALIAIAALFYLAQSTQTSAKKYTIMQLNETKTEIEAKGKDLEVEAARLKSLNEIKKSTDNSDLVPIEQSNYIDDSSIKQKQG